MRAPRYRWPFHSESSSFWQPLGFASMAAYVREHVDDVNVDIVDCPTLKIGWKSVRKELERRKPNVLCVGEETVSISEAFKLIALAKEVDPSVTIIAGGMYFSYMVEDSLKKSPIDFIIRLEGEVALTNLIKELKNPKRDQDFTRVLGISYREKGKVRNNLPQPPMRNLDDLPIPAYDLLPMEKYGATSKTHKRFVAVEHSRSCISKCNFCVLWRQLGQEKKNGGGYNLAYRTKSVQRTVDEVLHLKEKYNRKTFCWVDPTFNVSPKWTEEFADAMIESGADVHHTAWYRADFTIRDHKSGVLKKMVDAGLKQVQIGLERTDKKELESLEKNYTLEMLREAFSALREYPDVLSVATYIYGLPDETPQSMRRFYKDLRTIPFDFGLPIPLTPNPGGIYAEDEKFEELIEVKDYNYYNYINPVMRSHKMSIPQLIWQMTWEETKLNFSKSVASFFTQGHDRRHKAIFRLSKSKINVWRQMMQDITINRLRGKYTNYNIKPDWYDN